LISGLSIGYKLIAISLCIVTDNVSFFYGRIILQIAREPSKPPRLQILQTPVNRLFGRTTRKRGKGIWINGIFAASFTNQMNDKKIKPQFVSVPFKADSSNGITKYNGIAKFSPAGIVFEFDSIVFGLIGGEVKEVQVALDEILDIKFRKGIYKVFAQIQLRLKNFAKLSELPNYGGKVKLKIKREDFELAQEAVAKLQKVLIGQREFLPPAHTPVSRLFDESEEETKELN